MKLILKSITRIARSRSLRATGLNHEFVDHAMKLQPIIKTLLRQLLKVRDRLRRLVGVQPQFDRAPARLDRGGLHARTLAEMIKALPPSPCEAKIVPVPLCQRSHQSKNRCRANKHISARRSRNSPRWCRAEAL